MSDIPSSGVHPSSARRIEDLPDEAKQYLEPERPAYASWPPAKVVARHVDGFRFEYVIDNEDMDCAYVAASLGDALDAHADFTDVQVFREVREEVQEFQQLRERRVNPGQAPTRQ